MNLLPVKLHPELIEINKNVNGQTRKLFQENLTTKYRFP